MIDAGLAKKMSLRNFAGALVLQPASKGSEGSAEKAWSKWLVKPGEGCCLQDECGNCTIHDTDFKPIEGRLASCIEYYEAEHPELRVPIALRWEGELGMSLVDEWARQVGFDRDELASLKRDAAEIRGDQDASTD